MAAYGDSGSIHDYEYDHLVSLELGGAVNDSRNLWPEPGRSPNPKDAVENALHRMVCNGEMQLTQAQHIIATGWVAWAKSHGTGNEQFASDDSEDHYDEHDSAGRGRPEQACLRDQLLGLLHTHRSSAVVRFPWWLAEQ